jgi:hypothetical protein
MHLVSLAVQRSSHVCLSRSHRRFFLKWRSMVAVPFGWCNYPNLVQGRSKLRRVFFGEGEPADRHLEARVGTQGIAVAHKGWALTSA